MAKEIGANTRDKFTLCFECQNSVPSRTRGCEWSRNFQPVPGWNAEPTFKDNGKIPSYHVITCPKYIPDPPRPWAPDLGYGHIPIVPRPQEEYAV